MHARQALYQVSHIPCHAKTSLSDFVAKSKRVKPTKCQFFSLPHRANLSSLYSLKKATKMVKMDTITGGLLLSASLLELEDLADPC